MTDEQLIDAVARHLTSAAPTQLLRGRVLARIGEPTRAPWTRWLLPIGAAAVVALAVAVAVRDGRTPGEPSSTADASSASVAQVAPARGGDSDATPSTPASAKARHAVRRSAVPAWTEADSSWMERAVPPLPRPEAMTFESIQPIDLSIAPISVTAIVTEPLVLPPMTGGTEPSRQ